MRKTLALALLLPLAPACHYEDDDDGIIWYVDAVFGSDSSGDGTPEFPFRTITHAIAHARKNDLILVAPGTYSTAIGESFPLRIPENVTVEGDPGTKGNGSTATFITGGGTYNGVNTAIVIDSGAVFRGFLVTNTGGVGIVVDNDSCTIEFNTITGNNSDGIRLLTGGTATIQNNTISSNTGSGVLAQDATTPVLRQNTLSSNTVDGIRANGTSNPSLGTGGNTFSSNGGVGIFNNTTSSTIQAAGNTFTTGTQAVTGLVAGPVGYTVGERYAITNAAAAIQF